MEIRYRKGTCDMSTTSGRPTWDVADGKVKLSRQHIHVPYTPGERIADVVAKGMGSWKFIILQSILVSGWILLNFLAFMRHWDPYPFILLNLLFSTQAAYAAPIIVMSQNRQAQKDQLRDNQEADEVSLLYAINQKQLEILNLLQTRFDLAETTPVTAIASATDSEVNRRSEYEAHPHSKSDPALEQAGHSEP
jgi:uncharacterized membrane protein